MLIKQRRQFQEMLIHMHRINSKVQTEQCILAFCMQLITLGLQKKRKTPVKKNILCYRDGCVGSGSSVGIATNYGLTTGWSGRDRISVGKRFSARPDRPWAHKALCKMGTGSFQGVKCGRGVLLTTHLLLVPRSRKSRAIPLPNLRATPGL